MCGSRKSGTLLVMIGLPSYFGKGLAVICTVRDALGLALTSRSVESHNSTLAQTSGIILIYYGRTAEDGTTLHLAGQGYPGISRCTKSVDVECPQVHSPTVIRKDYTGNRDSIRHPYRTYR